MRFLALIFHDEDEGDSAVSVGMTEERLKVGNEGVVKKGVLEG